MMTEIPRILWDGQRARVLFWNIHEQLMFGGHPQGWAIMPKPRSVECACD